MKKFNKNKKLSVSRIARPRLLYIASRLPELSETFVYRELLGLRKRGYNVVSASVRAPKQFADDAALATLASESFIVYTPATLIAMPIALAQHSAQAIRVIYDAATADHSSIFNRAKHVVQGMMGIAAGWRLRHQGISHVHAHMAHVPATIGLYIARTLGAQFSFTGHAADLFVDRAALGFKLNHAAFVSCISYWHRNFYGGVTRIAERQLPVIRCSVALPDTIGEGRCEIVTVARLVSKKGIDLLIHAFANAMLYDWTLRILGDGPERSAIEDLAKRLDIAERIIFEGAQPHARCLSAIAESGIFVLPCRTATNGDKDGIPVVLMEAMAAGRAVIAGDLPAIRELIEHNRSGMLVLPDSADELSKAIKQLIDEPALRAKLGMSARVRIIEEFSDAVNLDRLSAAIEGAQLSS